MTTVTPTQILEVPTAISGVRFGYTIPPETRNLAIGIAAECTENLADRGALLKYTFFDATGNICIPAGNFSQSSKLGPFFYLTILDSDEQPIQKTVKALEVPPAAVRLVVSGVAWKPQMQTIIHEILMVTLDDSGLTKEKAEPLPDWFVKVLDPAIRKPWLQRAQDQAVRESGNSEINRKWSVDKEIVAKSRGIDFVARDHQSPGSPPANKVKVAIICDEFTYNSFSPEFESIVLLPETWREQMESFQPDIFLCESAWSGVDSRVRPWRGKIYGSIKFGYENRNVLFEILKYAKNSSIPSVFWNKEDPTHFPDRINDFVSTAARFDYVLTTAEEVLPDYCKFLPADRVGVMQFAAQPRTFNPLNVIEREKGAVFAGAWYKIHSERSRLMHQGFKYVMDSGIDLTIYDRNFGNNADLGFPSEYGAYIRRPVNHRATAALYRKYSLGLNFNTVVGSNTMFARRVFELAASGANVVSNYSPGIERIYGDDVIYFDRPKKMLIEYTDEELKTMSLRALNATLRRHTYRHRFEEILRFIGMPFKTVREKPTMITRVGSFDEADAALSYFLNKTQSFSRLLLVVSSNIPTSQASGYLTKYMSSNVTAVSESMLAKEKFPSSNFVQTADLIWVDPQLDITKESIEAAMLHGEYTHQPIAIADRVDIGWTAGSIRHGIRIAAPDVIDSILNPNMIRPILEVPRWS
ncbi:glycosyltransferase [Glutamicibacter protophormiae]|uniref:CgeB family protein n=1 Tax=Glutamicibacter protophormiae TaxID=37930 RepID=UPI002A7FE2F2|nr:glycosyltransferase [Glutamicibacter protophormiae]WPR66128.1 glycosyltransferase [Glutamicibacter protophormiae]WPR69625.1 glycosyltransferase [Glutamicibacter protophormiae]